MKSQILFSKKDIKPRIILVTSAFPGEGKTFVATNLAVCIAQGVNEFALLMDCDFHHPSSHKMLGYANKEGIQDYLLGKRQLSELIINTVEKKLSLLTSGRPSPNPSELLSSSMMKDLFDEVKGRYSDRYIVVDTAPSHVMSEVNVLANYVDGVIFVVMGNKSPRKVIKECIDKIGREKVLGIVFNGYNKPVETYINYYKNYYKKK